MKKLLIVIMLLFTTTVFAESSFVDVLDTDWYYDYVQILVTEDITAGYEDNTYRPTQNISVEEFVTLALKSIEQDELDVDKERWSDGFIQKALILNIIIEDEFLDYTRAITRGEMGRIVLRASDVELPNDYMSYAGSITDINSMNSYWQNIAVRIYSTGIISGYPDGSFALENNATRAEAAVILSKLVRPELRNTPVITVSKYDLRVAEIKHEWLNRLPVHSGELYEEVPGVEPVLIAGSLKLSLLTDGLNMMKFLRYLAGVSTDIYLSDQANDLSQHGALLLGVGEFSHTPDRPDNMSEEFYNKGYDATSTGNLAAGVATLTDAIKRLMDDSDEYNLEVIGHRRWQLLPSLKEFGLGFVETEGDYKYYTVMKVFKNLETESRTYDIISWPSETAFPIEFFDHKVPWSISLNPSIYDNNKIDEVIVEVKNKSTGLIWLFDQTDKDLSGEYFNVSTAGYGIPYCVIFRPNPTLFDSYDLETIYEVTVKNIYTNNGDKIEITYETAFFNLN